MSDVRSHAGHEEFCLPLEGYRFLEVGTSEGTCYVGFLAALAGASVCRVEMPGGEGGLGPPHNEAVALELGLLNVNKRSIVLDLVGDKGRTVFLDLVGQADVVFGDFGPRMDALGLAPETLFAAKPELVCGSLTPAGRTGELPELTSAELAIQAYVGLMSVTGFPSNPPVQVGPAVAAFFSGAHLYDGIVSGLFHRERTGRGCIIDIAMLDSLYPALMSNIGLVLGGPFNPTPREGNRNAGQACAPYNMYETSTGYVALRVSRDEHWQALVGLFETDHIGVPPGLESMADRVASVDLVDEIVGAWTRRRSTTEACAAIDAAGVPCGPVRTIGEVVQDPHLRTRGIVVDRSHAGGLPIGLQTPLRFYGETPPPLGDAPSPSEHDFDVLGEWLGVSPEDVAELRATSVLRGPDVH